MARHSANSLKGKIWLTTSALAFFIFTFGIVSYLVISLFSENSLYFAVVQFLLLALAIMIFGWWLSNEVVTPVEKVTLLAKSLERGVLTTLPKTSGSAETDELLQTLHRNNQQLQNLVGLMDKVSSGNLNFALTPLQQSDRLSNSFQKLLTKVTESINAKRDLDRLRAIIKQISEEISPVRNGNFDVEIKSDFLQTREISETLKFTIHRLNELIYHIKGDSKQAHAFAKEVQKSLQVVISADENRIREMSQAPLALKQIPQTVQKISEELYASSQTARQSIERARSGLQTAQENVAAADVLRQQIREAVKRIGRLSERTREIGKVAKTIGDLAQRTNMIALNASIQAATGERGCGFVAFTEEVERLAERAAATNKQISTLNKTIAAEIGEIERSLQDSVGEAANLSRFAIETGSSLSELEKYIGQFLNLQEKLAAFSVEQTADTELAFQSFVASIAETENAVKNLKESETQISQVAISMENLQLAVADYKTPQTAAKPIPAANELISDLKTEFYT
jgi:methyl-accepting chemotaxis protein